MKQLINVIVVLSLLLITGCASGLNSIQKREYSQFKNEGVLVKEKDPTIGMVLGLLPGGGSFYAREPALGVVNLLLWPWSILWDPISGKNGSTVINYDITKYSLKKEKDKELTNLDTKFSLGEIDNKEYIAKKRKIETKYTY